MTNCKPDYHIILKYGYQTKPGADFFAQFWVLITVDILIFLANNDIIKQLEIAFFRGRIL